jgi:isoleucyl-tRNA synthetase
MATEAFGAVLNQFRPILEFGENDEDVAKYWGSIELYQLLEKRGANGPLYRFMDGPPFVSSKNLHLGHVHISACKSVSANYRRMLGDKVLNQLGFDCHGLPIEVAVNNMLGIKTKEDVEKMGVGNYNEACRSLIREYSGSWAPVFNRIGRFIDFENSYKTMDLKFMETVWWCFKQLWDKKLVYNAYKIMAYSTGAQTPLSTSEAAEDYQDRQDQAVYVKFETADESNCFYVAWTTTPWTLPSNLALCVNPELEYVKVKDLNSGEFWICASLLLAKLYNMNSKKIGKNLPYEIVDKFTGLTLVGKRYKPLFPYFSGDPLFKILGGSHVTSNAGTGIVHTAPAFGEEDFEVCQKNGVVSSRNIIEYCPVDDNGCFTEKVSDYRGIYVFDANPMIIEKLKQMGTLVRKDSIVHSYPYCGRTKTPLIYRAVPNYFIAISEIREKILENNAKINWIPKNIGENRFAQNIKSAPDWGVSRSRYFGTPLPIWVSDDGEESICVGSLEELVELASLTEIPTDIHREVIDAITIPSRQGKGLLRNCSQVFDCWFESGCVPFGQLHYPFENSDILEGVNKEEAFLSDFVCEGIDQTRGWFYTLLVLSTAICNKPAFKNVICAGLILAKDGKKFAKRSNNCVPPMEILSKYGADALRLYLSSSPAAHGESFKFIEEDIGMMNKKLIQWLNGCRFFIEHYTKFMKDGNCYDNTAYQRTENIIDRWIISRIGTLVKNIRTSMDSYEIYRVTDEILDAIEDVTNWYIKFNRNRIRGKNCSIVEQCTALSTLWYVYYMFVQATAPFVPYLSEMMYQELKKLSNCHQVSVLLEPYPSALSFIQEVEVERKMKRLQQVALLIRQIRSSDTAYKMGATTVRMPVRRVTISHEDIQFMLDVKEFDTYLKNEANVLEIEYRSNEELVTYGIVIDPKKIGTKYRADASVIRKALSELSSANLKVIFEEKSSINLEIGSKHYTIEPDEFSIKKEVNYVSKECEECRSEKSLWVLVDFTKDDEIVEIYRTRMFVTKIQHMRKDTELRPWNKIGIYYGVSDESFKNTIIKYSLELATDLLYEVHPLDEIDSDESVIISEKTIIDGCDIEFVITDPTGTIVRAVV